MKNFIKKHFLLKNLWWLLTILIIILPFVPIVNDCLLEKFTFIITALAFLAAAKAIILQKEAMKQQKEDGKKAEELLKEQIEKQEIIGAWQLLNTKASGNSGKKEAIEFLASKGADLSGIDLSTETHGGFVYLQELFKDYKGDRSKINLINTNFSGANLGANLMGVDFSETNLAFAKFNNAMIKKAKFNGANLTGVDFLPSYYLNNGTIEKGDDYFNEAEFTDSYINHKVHRENGNFTPLNLPRAPAGYKFELDERINKNGEPIYPLGDEKYCFIKLAKRKPQNYEFVGSVNNSNLIYFLYDNSFISLSQRQLYNKILIFTDNTKTDEKDKPIYPLGDKNFRFIKLEGQFAEQYPQQFFWQYFQ